MQHKDMHIYFENISHAKNDWSKKNVKSKKP